jgi:hypothetical protein
MDTSGVPGVARRKALRATWPTAVALVALLLVGPSPVDAAPNTTYVVRATFEAQLAAPIVDDFEAPPYPAGFQILNNATMSAVLGETDYETTGFPDWNILPGSGTYCAGCNGSFRLSFQTTSVGTADGVFGVGFDVVSNSTGLPYHAFVTFADGSTQDFALPSGSSFFGITSPTLIRSIHLGLAGGATTTSGSFVMDNLTIGAVACADMTPPTVVCNLTRSILLPARNGLVPVGLTFSATDDTDPSPTIEVTVYSDEPVGNAPFAPDALLASGQWTLRAERSWTANGRVYLIVVKATDACGNSGYACCTAVVPLMPTTYWITQALMEATVARNACQASGTGDPGTFTQVSP